MTGFIAQGSVASMHVRLPIDGIVRQTTVLIAQLSTAAGVREFFSSRVYNNAADPDECVFNYYKEMLVERDTNRKALPQLGTERDWMPFLWNWNRRGPGKSYRITCFQRT